MHESARDSKTLTWRYENTQSGLNIKGKTCTLKGPAVRRSYIKYFWIIIFIKWSYWCAQHAWFGVLSQKLLFMAYFYWNKIWKKLSEERLIRCVSFSLSLMKSTINGDPSWVLVLMESVHSTSKTQFSHTANLSFPDSSDDVGWVIGGKEAAASEAIRPAGDEKMCHSGWFPLYLWTRTCRRAAAVI